jgi:hypothetical protein
MMLKLSHKCAVLGCTEQLTNKRYRLCPAHQAAKAIRKRRGDGVLDEASLPDWQRDIIYMVAKLIGKLPIETQPTMLGVVTEYVRSNQVRAGAMVYQSPR